MHSMTPSAFRAALVHLRFSQAEFARFIAVDRQTVYRWAAGINAVPRTVELLLLMMTHIGSSPARKLAERR
jgi:DNA-binding transcriptional regulator YiaG